MSKSHAATDRPPPGLPVVIQLGFAGSRALFDPEKHPGVDPAKFEAAVLVELTARLERLGKDLGASPTHFFCGISALAIGADTLFTRACQTLNWSQRLFLPQQREDFLAAGGTDGPDFSEAERTAARNLFGSTHVIQKRVVSESLDRHTRFHEVNLELVRVSDVMVCLVDASASGKSGGTQELMKDAKSRKRTLLEIQVEVKPGGTPKFKETWHRPDEFKSPALPEELDSLQTDLKGIPTSDEYCRCLKDFASEVANWKQKIFKWGAMVVIVTHVFATLLAVVALANHEHPLLRQILGVELVLLLAGFATHQFLHGSHSTPGWAMSRLVAELARSCGALREIPGYLMHLFILPLPEELRHLVRTLNVLHLRDTRALPPDDWDQRRKNYVKSRLVDLKHGQIAYYKKEFATAKCRQCWAYWTFVIVSFCAIGSTLYKLLIMCDCSGLPHELHHEWKMICGVLAVILPIMAVAALSLAASFDVDARAHTYKKMRAFLMEQRNLLAKAPSESAVRCLAMETEMRLIGETAGWYSRRTFTSVT